MIALDLLRATALKRGLAGKQLVEDGSQSVEVAANIDLLAEDALGAHIERRAGRCRRAVYATEIVPGMTDARQTEVEQDELPECIQANVAGSQVAVKNLLAPGIKKSLVDLDDGQKGIVEVEAAAACEQMIEIFAGDVGHNEIVQAVAFPNVEDWSDVGMAGKAGSNHGFAAKAAEDIAVSRQRGVKNLNCDESMMPAMTGKIDTGHATNANEAENEVVAGEEDRKAIGYVACVGFDSWMGLRDSLVELQFRRCGLDRKFLWT
jgi:hypothetical protein